jgi:BASS family bile acid:Na+ symporter
MNNGRSWYNSKMFPWYPDYEYPLARLQLVLFMLGMGATLSVADFFAVLRRPRSFLVGFTIQVLLLPWLAVAINALGQLEGGIAVGLVLVAAMPGGALSKLFTYLGRGNVPLSITLSAFTTLACLVSVPMLLQLLAARYIPDDFHMPVRDIVLDVALCLLLPLSAGMVLVRGWPRLRRPLARGCVRLGFVVVVIMVLGSLGRINPGEHGLGVALAIVLFCLAGQQLSMLPFYVTRWPRPDRMAVGTEVTMRNMNLALLLKAILFPPDNPLGDGVLFVILFYAGTALGCGLPLALNHRRLARKETPVLESRRPWEKVEQEEPVE